ncbi:MAG: helix-turn-helix domain-containing protein [Saprospiraceae bacterium]|nr:helix-turn-helix domain-containing protein [Saprospiraceae bacterium]
MKCPTCFEGTLETKRGDYLEGKYTIQDGEWQECANCGEILFGPEMMEKLQKAYYYNNGLLFPEEIKERRETCKRTQADLALRLGVSVNSIKRWEKGSFIQPEDKDKRIKEILQAWESENLTSLTSDAHVARLMDKSYSAPYAFARNTEGNLCDDEKNIKKIIKKIK